MTKNGITIDMRCTVYCIMSLIMVMDDKVYFISLSLLSKHMRMLFIGVKTLTKFNQSRASADIGKVTKAMKDALFSPKPGKRYLVGLEAKLIAFIAYLPSSISDYILQASGQFSIPESAKM